MYASSAEENLPGLDQTEMMEIMVQRFRIMFDPDVLPEEVGANTALSENALLKVLPRGARRHGRRIPPLAHTRHLANPIQKHERFEHVIPRTSACKSYPINARFENVIPHTPACKSYPKHAILKI